MREQQPAVDDPESEARPPLSRKRKAQFAAAFVGFLLLVLLVGEISARVHYAGRFPNSDIPHPDRGHANRPGWEGFEGKERLGITARFNSRGMREDREVAPSFAGKRVLVVGDSVVFGYRLKREDGIAARLEEALGDDGDGPWQALNLGCFGYMTKDEVVWLRELADEGFRADLVVLVVCYNDYGQPDTTPVTINRAAEWIEDNSALVFAINRKLRKIKDSIKRNNNELTAEQIRGRYVTPKSQAKSSAERMADDIMAAREQARRLGARMLVAIWPGQDQFRAFKESGAVPPEQARTLELLADRAPELPVFLPFDYLKDKGDHTDLYYDHCHPSVKGVKVFAPELERRGRAALRLER